MSITTMTFAARGFSARRGASDEHTLQGSVRSEQRSLVEKELPPEGLRRIWPVAALLVGHRSTSGYAPSSRLATGQIRRNECHRSYVHDHLGRVFHTAFLRMGGTGYQPVLVGNLPTRRGRAPCRDEEMRHEKFDASLPPGW